MAKQKEKKVDKQVLSFFMIAFPTVLIIALFMIVEDAWWVTILLAIYQFVLLKQFLDTYYNLLE